MIGRIRDWWRLQRERARAPFDFDLPESDEPALPMMVKTMGGPDLGEYRQALEAVVAALHAPRTELAPSATDMIVLPYICPMCEGDGRCESLAGRCPECDGRGAISNQAAEIWADVADVQLKRAPTPPAVMRSPCGSCAFRPGAPEEDEPPSLEQPFYCHTGMPVVSGSYAPIAWAKGMPLGAMVCAGWWAAVTDKDLPARAYRAATDGWGDRD